MQVYTKILIGMLVGILVGLLLGPNSSLLNADIYKITQWDRLDLRIDRDAPTTAVPLPGSTAKPPPLVLSILETIDEDDVLTWSRVELEIDEQLLLRDRTGEVAKALGDPEV